jgi:hypothetical protein
MVGGRYRLRRPVRAVCAQDGQKSLVLLPEGSIISVADSIGAERLIPVTWEQTDFIVFAEDVRERGAMLTEQ